MQRGRGAASIRHKIQHDSWQYICIVMAAVGMVQRVSIRRFEVQSGRFTIGSQSHSSREDVRCAPLGDLGCLTQWTRRAGCAV
ncbi:hypothetical protein XF_2204 [Xylella fastidiosa 9a5c]|uniref:Uncharacterized protein n=1 Tax=Xylella fastidiosa (strain 9a5c) TaxID=160492 RepID=Q9PBE0_XYLFA|nr:hypothetical protein XF_2204 [Xylella fastidiosa 9a5c]